MTNESPIVSFRVPLDVVERLITEGKLKKDFNKSDLSNLIKNEWLASIGAEVKVPIDANSVYSKLDELSQRLASLENTLSQNTSAKSKTQAKKT